MNISDRGQELVTASDGLPALSVAAHAREKEYALRNITDIFTKAMKNKWPGRLYYGDPFCGPGKCVIRNSGEETDGSPTIAAGVPFSHYFFADQDQRAVDALKERVERMDLSEGAVRYFTGYADETIDVILRKLPPAGLSLGLAFLDPWA